MKLIHLVPLFSQLLAVSAGPILDNRQSNAPITVVNGQTYACKCYKTDSCWPSASASATLNTAVGGNLRATTPIGASCYRSYNGLSTYNSQTCQAAQANSKLRDWMINQDSTNLWPYWTNNTCNPSSSTQNSICGLSFVPEYTIVAKTKEHIQAGVNFARTNNLRLIIRNTGHDFMGRSTGYGALAINTHNFKDMTWIKAYTGPGNWTGGAVTIGAGMQTADLYKLAYNQNPKVVVVGGECATVGLAGGYIQGGGHGPLASYFGMGKVLTRHFLSTLSRQDLFWALKGGGPSSFGVVVSVTIKTFPEMPSTGITLSINTWDQNLFWKGLADFHNMASYFVDNGIYVWYALPSGSLSLQPIAGPNMNKAKLEAVVKPFFDKLRADNVPFTSTTREFSTFYDLYIALFADDTTGFQGMSGGRIFTKQDIASNGNAIVNAYKTVLAASSGSSFTAIGGHIVGPGKAVPVADNAMYPAWRDTVSASISIMGMPEGLTWQQRQDAERRLTDVVDKLMRDASPSSATYVNEANINEPNWQQSYWGANYPRLLQVRKKWDPNGVFYAKSTPRTEHWTILEYGTRLCKKV